MERSASNKVSNLLPVDESFKDPLNRPFEYLDYKDALPYNISSILRDLRNLRNQAAHLGTREISRQDVLQYAEVAARVWRHIEIIEDLPKVKLTAFTVLILQINSLIDSKNFDDISIDEVHDWIENKRVIPALSERAKGRVDLSLYGKGQIYSNFSVHYHNQMHALAGGYAGQERRKWGVENLGLCLLLAWTNELIQQGSGWRPTEM